MRDLVVLIRMGVVGYNVLSFRLLLEHIMDLSYRNSRKCLFLLHASQLDKGNDEKVLFFYICV